MTPPKKTTPKNKKQEVKKKVATKTTKKTTSKKKDDSVKKIPLTHVVHVDIDDEVSSVFEKVQSKTSDLVYLVVPHRSVLFQSIVNVKIVKRKAKDIGKEIAFITKDKSGVFFANKCNIPVFDQVGTNKKEITADNIPDTILTEADRLNAELGIKKEIKVSKNTKSKRSIAELLKILEYKSYIQRVQKFFYRLSRKQSRKQYAQKLLMSNPNRTLLVSLTIGSVLLFSLITYVALPNATITLKPNSVPIEQPVNITLADAQTNAGLLRTRPSKTIASYPVTPGTLEISLSFDATGADLDTPAAKGIVTIYNKESREFPLVPYTRFQSEDGLIFRTQAFVNVPAGNEENPSQLQIEILADPVDINNLPIGERGNLPPDSKFTVPGLTHVSGDKLYAINTEPFTGGVTSEKLIVTTRDVEAATEFVKAELIKQVPKKIQEYLVKYNTDKNLNLALVNDPQLIKLSEIQVTIDDSIIGQKMKDFVAVARAEVSAIAYDRTEFIKILKEEISLRKSPDKELTQVDESGIVMRILSLKEDIGIVEVTATIQGVEQYNLSDHNESGKRIIKKIQDHAAGLEVKEAREFIESLPEIESAEITTWPMWAPTIPSNPDSIKIIIDET